MKISLTNLSYKKLKFEEFLNIVEKNNFKNIEIAPTLIGKNLLKSRSKINRILKQKKIKVLAEFEIVNTVI